MNRIEPDFKALFESSPECYIVLLPDFTIVAASSSYLSAAKTERQKILGRSFFDVFPEANSEGELLASLQKVLKTRAPDHLKARKYDRPVGESDHSLTDVKYWNSINSPVLSPDGEVRFIIRRVRDVTKIVHQDGERKVIEQERDLFFTHSFDFFAIVGTDGYFKKTNPSFERVMGYTEQELLAKPVVEFLHPEDVGKTQKGIQKLAAGTPTIASVNRYRCKDGSYKWISWNTTPIESLLYTVGRDITEQVNAEECIKKLNLELGQKNEELEQKIIERVAELQRSEAQVQQLQKMDAIGRLAGGIAHDFNNILSAISMYCDLLADDSEKPEAVRAKVEDIRQVTARAAGLTRQLLIFSRKQMVQLQTLSLNPLIEQLEKMLVRLIGENIKIVKHLSPDLRNVSVDPTQIEQVALNLVVNAKDAMPRGGTITIETSNVFLDETFTSTHLSVSRGHYVLFSVSDNGSGMDLATQSKAFEPFFTTKPVGKGTGLGLSTTYGIIKQSKGTIWVYSELGKGTVVKIYLPVADKIAEDTQIIPEKIVEVRGTQTILLVEDDENLREGFSMMLRRKGYEVLVTAGGDEALSVCKSYEGPIHLLLTDVVMPGLSGFELAKQILALRSDLCVLYMSGYTSDALENSGMDYSDELAFIQKPFNTTTLVQKVQLVLAHAKDTKT